LYGIYLNRKEDTMYKLNEQQERRMDKQLLISADSYAKCLMDSINTSSPSDTISEIDDSGNLVTTHFYEKGSYVRAAVIELVQEITENERLSNYESFPEHLNTFEQYVSDNMEDGWIFTIGDNDDAQAIKVKEVVLT
jgi:hypothetical protein